MAHDSYFVLLTWRLSKATGKSTASRAFAQWGVPVFCYIYMYMWIRQGTLPCGNAPRGMSPQWLDQPPPVRSLLFIWSLQDFIA